MVLLDYFLAVSLFAELEFFEVGQAFGLLKDVGFDRIFYYLWQGLADDSSALLIPLMQTISHCPVERNVGIELFLKLAVDKR